MTEQAKKQNRIVWIDGIKGLACFLVFSCHFLLAFFPATYFGTEVPSYLPFELDVKMSYTPIGIVNNGNFWVCVFLTIACYLAASRIMNTDNEKLGAIIPGMLVKRYFRLMIPCGAAGILYYVINELLFALKLNYYPGLVNTLSFPKLIYHVLFKMWFEQDTEVLGPYWMLCPVFLGTFIAILLAIAERYEKQWMVLVFYGVMTFCLFKLDPYYLCAAVAVWTAYLEKRVLRTIKHTGAMEALGFAFILVGLYLGAFPSYAPPGFFYSILVHINRLFPNMAMIICHSMGAGLFMIGMMLAKPAQRLFSNRLFAWLGKISLGIFVLHIPVIQYFAYFLDDTFKGLGLSYCIAALFAYLIVMAILLPVSYLFMRTVEEGTQKLLKKF